MSVDAEAVGARHRPGGRLFRRALARAEWLLDESEASRTPVSRRIRLVVAILFFAYGVLLEVVGLRHDDVKLVPLFFAVAAVPIVTNRLGRFVHYFLPVFLGLFAYATAASYATQFKLGVHYKPQIWAEQHLLPGPMPTLWLQRHLYTGKTGPVEILSVAAYAGHFLIPLALAMALALSGRSRAFRLLVFGILTVAVLGSATFVLAPTAPPWLAAEHGYLPPVHHILKHSLAALHLKTLAAIEGDPGKYDVTAAAPSLHTAFPLLCLLTAIEARLPRWAIAALALDVLLVVFAIVYTGEHYVFDAAAGAFFALGAWLVVRRLVGDDSPAGTFPVSRDSGRAPLND